MTLTHLTVSKEFIHENTHQDNQGMIHEILQEDILEDTEKEVDEETQIDSQPKAQKFRTNLNCVKQNLGSFFG